MKQQSIEINKEPINYSHEAYAIRIKGTPKYCSDIRGYTPVFSSFNIFVSKTFISKAMAEVYVESIKNIVTKDLEICKVKVFCNIEGE